MKKICNLICLFVFVAMMFVGSVSASWSYSASFVENISSFMQIEIKDFEFAPEEILPDDDTADQAGANHVTLLHNIVDHVKYGLNATSKPIVNEILQEGKGIVYSQQKVQGGNLKHLLLRGDTVDHLDFAVQYVSSTEYACYTFSTDEITSSNSGKQIQVYKTKIIYQESKWVAVASYEGVAVVARVNANGSLIMAINVSSWVKV